MRITFEDGGYLEFQRSKNIGKMWIMIATRKDDDPLKLQVNSAEAEVSEVLKGVQSVTGPIMLDKQQ